MSRLHTSFVLGYHGCSRKTGDDVLSGLSSLQSSNNDYDWLGPGIYFWEADPIRALEWAEWKYGRKEGGPFVIGAAIDLGECLDLIARESLSLLKNAYEEFANSKRIDAGAEALPENKRASHGDSDRLLRFLDCAVIRHLHAAIEGSEIPDFDTVRGMFTEGNELYPGAGFLEKSHVQIAVCNPKNIKGYFRVDMDTIQQKRAAGL